jgi:hypothetical protein
MGNVFGARFSGLTGFLSCMLNDTTGLGCGLVQAVGSILTNRHTYTENQQCGNPCNFKCLHRFSFSFTANSLSNIYFVSDRLHDLAHLHGIAVSDFLKKERVDPWQSLSLRRISVSL